MFYIASVKKVGLGLVAVRNVKFSLFSHLKSSS